jgi:hypothetical protein
VKNRKEGKYKCKTFNTLKECEEWLKRIKKNPTEYFNKKATNENDSLLNKTNTANIQKLLTSQQINRYGNNVTDNKIIHNP